MRNNKICIAYSIWCSGGEGGVVQLSSICNSMFMKMFMILLYVLNSSNLAVKWNGIRAVRLSRTGPVCWEFSFLRGELVGGGGGV